MSLARHGLPWAMGLTRSRWTCWTVETKHIYLGWDNQNWGSLLPSSTVGPSPNTANVCSWTQTHSARGEKKRRQRGNKKGREEEKPKGREEEKPKGRGEAKG